MQRDCAKPVARPCHDALTVLPSVTSAKVAEVSLACPSIGDSSVAPVEVFENLIGEWEEPSPHGIGVADASRFHAAFCRIPVALREEEMDWALNLIPDENVMVLASVLLDKSQPVEVLDSIFCDVLNRNEDVKNVLLRKIWEDKSHPCWKDADWVLEITEQGSRMSEHENEDEELISNE